MQRLAVFVATLLAAATAAADPQPAPKGMEFAAALGATAAVEQGDAPGVGAGGSLAFSGTGVWSIGGRAGALWFVHDATHHRLLQFHFLVRHRVDRFTLGFGAGLDSHATRDPDRTSTYFFGASVDVAYTLARSGSHLLELTAGASISPVFDVIAALDSGELTANDRVFSATVGLGYRYR